MIGRSPHIFDMSQMVSPYFVLVTYNETVTSNLGLYRLVHVISPHQLVVPAPYPG